MPHLYLSEQACNPLTCVHACHCLGHLRSEKPHLVDGTSSPLAFIATVVSSLSMFQPTLSLLASCFIPFLRHKLTTLAFVLDLRFRFQVPVHHYVIEFAFSPQRQQIALSNSTLIWSPFCKKYI